MEYRVVPFSADIKSHEGGEDAAANLQSLIESMAEDGWEFVDFEQIQTYQAGSSGCFGFGETEPQTFTITMVIFRK
ncbi:MAG: hypothetical protein ABEL04_08645 [Salinibacter sp.]|uniref:hypothetical protein n=1 Tax=Salinibacter sp. TaxID=2065818 RepID=UPI0035D4373F